MTAPRPRKRIRLWLWALSGIFVVWLAVLSYLTFGIPHEVIRRDPLLDMYLSALGPDGRIRGSTLDEWDRLFPDDPRTLDLSVLEWSGQTNNTELLDYIRELNEGGYRVSPAAQAFYIRQKEASWREETTAFNNPPDTDPKTVPEKAERNKLEHAWDLAICREIDQAHRAERDQAYSELQRLAPKTSMTWYMSASLAFRRGNNAGAIELLHRGNAARDNTRLLPYPLPMFIQDLRSDGPLANDPRAADLGGILVSNSTHNFIEMKRMHRELCHWAAQKKDGTALNELHQYACRVATSDDALVINALTAVILLGIELDAVQQMTHLTSEQSKAISELQSKRSKVKAELKRISQSNPTTYTSKPGLIGFLRTRGSSFYQKEQLNYFAYEEQELVSKIFPLVKEISTFDFVTMSFQP